MKHHFVCRKVYNTLSNTSLFTTCSITQQLVIGEKEALFGTCSVTQQLVIEEKVVVKKLVGKENDQALNVKKILVTEEKEDVKILVGKENDQPLNVNKIYRKNLQT